MRAQRAKSAKLRAAAAAAAHGARMRARETSEQKRGTYAARDARAVAAARVCAAPIMRNAARGVRALRQQRGDARARRQCAKVQKEARIIDENARARARARSPKKSANQTQNKRRETQQAARARRRRLLSQRRDLQRGHI